MYVCMRVCMYVCMYVCLFVCLFVCIYIYMCVCLCVRACAYACRQRHRQRRQQPQRHNKTSVRIDATPSAERSRMATAKQTKRNYTLRRSTVTILHHSRKTPPTHDGNTHAKHNTTPSLALPPCNVDVWRGGAELFPFVEIHLGAFSSNITMGVCEGDRGGQPRLSQLMIAKWCRIDSVNSYPMQ